MDLRRFSLLVAASLLLPVGSAFALSNPQASENLATFRSNRSEIVAQRGDGSGRRGGRRGGGMQQLLQQLNLTPDQQQRIQSIMQASRSEKEGLRQQMQQAKQQLRSLASGNASESQLRQQYQRVQSVQQQMSNHRFETMLKIRAELTPEQRAQMAQLMEQQKERRQNRRSQGGGNFGPQQGNF